MTTAPDTPSDGSGLAGRADVPEHTVAHGSPSDESAELRDPAARAGGRCQREFCGQARELESVRQWLRALLPACPSREDLVLVASELSANAIRHTASGRGGRFAVEIASRGSVIRVTVIDGGAPTGPCRISDPLAENGRGLLVVDALAERTGEVGDHRGRLVWADIRWPAALPPIAPDSGPDRVLPAVRSALTG